MKVLVIGSGGREHALAWKISQSNQVSALYAAPGNPGIARVAECVAIDANDIDNLLAFAKKKAIDLTVVGPEDPLVNGIVDRFEAEGLNIFGPSKKAAQLEGSKTFTRELLKRHAIPSPHFRSFTNQDEALDYLSHISYPTVVKVDGLAAGKGVFVCQTRSEAMQALHTIMKEHRFGDAGKAVVIEEFLTGQEISILAITDGTNIVPLDPSQDHKPAFDGDDGPNTGGMGAYSPVPAVTPRLMSKIIREILVPTVHALKMEECDYRGVLYAGLMLTEDGPKVLEYNVRFGDPETQPLMRRIKSDIVPLLIGTTNGSLGKTSLEWYTQPALCVIMASDGYPGDYTKGMAITGIDEAEKVKGVTVFQAGTDMEDDQLVTSGGRVLGVTAIGSDLIDARELVYAAVETINFEGAHWRTDIAHHAIDILVRKKEAAKESL